MPSEGGLVLISHLPLLVEADFQLRFKLPGSDGQVHLIDPLPDACGAGKMSRPTSMTPVLSSISRLRSTSR
jgi:hypothetical protein